MSISESIKRGVVYNHKGVKMAICYCGKAAMAEPYYESNTHYNHKCPKCGNLYYMEFDNKSDKNIINRQIGSLFNIVHKDDYGFTVTKTIYNAHINKTDAILNFIPKDIYRFTLNFKDVNNPIKLFKNEDPLETITESRLRDIFNNDIGDVEEKNILYEVSTEKNYPLFKMAYERMGKWRYEREYKFSRALSRLCKYPALQILSMCGFNENALRYCYESKDIRHSSETQPHKILGVPKYVLHYLKDGEFDVGYGRDRERLRRLINMFDGNIVKMILQIFHEESTMSQFSYCVEDILMLYTDYDYKDVIKLVEYTTRNAKLEQGLTSPNDVLSLLKDYVRIMKMLGHEYEKYPKSLKKVHDIASMNYQICSSKKKEDEFTSVINNEEYTRLNYSDKQFLITIPKNIKDVVNEGKNLSHCVASYVNDIIKGKCKIVFLRSKFSPESSLVTIEIRDNKLKQIRGRFNRNPIAEETVFTKKWIKNKGIECDILK